MQDGYQNQLAWMPKLLNLNDEFWDQDRKTFFFHKDGDEKVGGYYRQTGNFTLMSVPKSGHFVPYGYYDASKAIIDDYVQMNQLKCLTDEGDVDPYYIYCRAVENMCDAMNQCNGNGVCYKKNG